MNQSPHSLAGLLFEAYISRKKLPVFSRRLNLSEEDAYAVQDSFVKQVEAYTRKNSLGYKIGGCSYNGEKGKFGFHYGHLIPADIYADGSSIEIPEEGIFAEAEIGLYLNEQIRSVSCPDDIFTTIDAVVPVLELTRPRFSGERTLSDTICDNAAHLAVVTGCALPCLPDPDLEFSPAITINSMLPEYRRGSASIRMMADYILLLKDELQKRSARIQPGSLFLSGTLSRPSLQLHPGDSIMVDFGGHLCVSAHFPGLYSHSFSAKT